MLWKNPDGTLALMAFAIEPVTPEEIAATVDKIVDKGRFARPAYCGMVTPEQMPQDNRYSRAWRWSAGAVVVKLDLAKDEHWRYMKEEAEQKLKDTMMDAVLEMENFGHLSVSQLRGYRSRLRDIIAVKPQGIVDAKDLTELKAVRPSVLDEPKP